MARDAGGRFLPRLGQKLTPDNADPGTSVTLLPPLDDELGPDEWGVSRSCAGITLDFSPVPFVDAARRNVLRHLRGSILTGKRPDTGGEQRELGPKAAADPARQSPYRGYRTGFLADHITSRPIKSDGRTATAQIVGPPERNAFLGKERARGVNLLTLAGKSGEAAKEAMAEVLKAVTTGREVLTNKGDTDAEDA